MKHARYNRLMSSLAVQVAREALNAAEMAEQGCVDVDPESVSKACEEIRDRLLWIEQAAHGIIR